MERTGGEGVALALQSAAAAAAADCVQQPLLLLTSARICHMAPADAELLSGKRSERAAQYEIVSRQSFLKYASLVTLTIQNAFLSLMMRSARTRSELFITSSAVIMSELLKIVTCLVVVVLDEGSPGKAVHALRVHIWQKPAETLKVAVPSILYYFQNNLIYISATHLDAATSQVTYQMKILTTAVFSVMMLKKKLQPHQWFALVLLFVGVALVQLLQIQRKSDAAAADTHQSPITGFAAIVAACMLSGFAGVYFEKMLKGSKEVSLWIRNIQLAAIAVPFGLLQLLLTDAALVQDKGFFYGYSLLTWSVIVLQAQGGLLVAVVVKYADNILKGFATSLSIVLSSVASVYLFHFELSLQFAVGAGLVIASIFVYGKQVSRTPVLPVARQ